MSTPAIIRRLESCPPGLLQRVWQKSFPRAGARSRVGAIIQKHLERTPEVGSEDIRSFFLDEKLPGEHWYEE